MIPFKNVKLHIVKCEYQDVGLSALMTCLDRNKAFTTRAVFYFILVLT